MQMAFDTLELEIQENGIAILTINRPDAMNAINAQMMDDYNKAMDLLNDSFDTRVVIVTGADQISGKHIFSAGILGIKTSMVAPCVS